MDFPTNLILSQDDVVWLDGQTLAFRKNNGKSLSRSALMRAVLQGARAVELDLSWCHSEKQIAEGIADLLRRGSEHLRKEIANRTPGSRNDSFPR